MKAVFFLEFLCNMDVALNIRINYLNGINFLYDFMTAILGDFNKQIEHKFEGISSYSSNIFNIRKPTTTTTKL